METNLNVNFSLLCLCCICLYSQGTDVLSWCFCVTVAKAYTDLNLFQKKHDVNPLRGFLVPLVQVGLSPNMDSALFLQISSGQSVAN